MINYLQNYLSQGFLKDDNLRWLYIKFKNDKMGDI